MKYKKIIRVLALGILCSSTVFGSTPTFAEEHPSSTRTLLTQQKDDNLNSEETEDSEHPIPKPDLPKSYNLLVGDSLIENNTYSDSKGNQINFQYTTDTGLVANTVVHYTVKLVEDTRLKEIRVINATTNELILSSNEINGVFTIPESDVRIQLETKKEEKIEPEVPVKSEEKSNEISDNKSTSNKGVTTINPNNHDTKDTAPKSSAANRDTAVVDRTTETTNSGVTDSRIPSSHTVPTLNNTIQTSIVQETYRHLGKPYVWGAKGPNAFDCSGLAYFVYANALGYSIGGWTGDQQYAGTQIPVSEAQPGDLLFWGAPTSITTHVAIYIGSGQYVHAPQPGDVVKIETINNFTPTFAVRVSIDGLPKATNSLSNAFGEYSTNQPFIFNKNQTTDQFIKKIGEPSREIGQKYGIYSSVMIAQAILESGSGNSSLASEPNYNLFGIKGKFKNSSVTFKTLEQDKDGANYQIRSEFRKYPSYKESLEDYAKLIKEGISGNKEFYKAAWKDQTKSYKDATKHLQGRYATDKQYAEKLNAIIKAYDLMKFDHVKKSKKRINGPEIRSIKTDFKANDDLQLKLIASVTSSQFIPQSMLPKHFIQLFRGECLIAVAVTAFPKRMTLSVLFVSSSRLKNLSKTFNDSSL